LSGGGSAALGRDVRLKNPAAPTRGMLPKNARRPHRTAWWSRMGSPFSSMIWLAAERYVGIRKDLAKVSPYEIYCRKHLAHTDLTTISSIRGYETLLWI
jgi:hypothetical protein